MTGVPGLFLLCWPHLRMPHRLRLAWGCVLGTGSWGGREAPRGIVEGPGLETSKQHRAVLSTPGGMAAHGIGHPESSLPEVPRFISMEIGALPVPSPHPTALWVVQGTQGMSVSWGPHPLPEERTGRTGRDMVPWRTDIQTGLPPSLGAPATRPRLGRGSNREPTYPPHQYHSTQASCSSSTKQGIASTLKKTTPTMSETESRWFCRHCWNLPRAGAQSRDLRRLPGSSPRPPGHTTSQVIQESQLLSNLSFPTAQGSLVG